MLKITKDPQIFFAKLQAFSSIAFIIGHLTTLWLNIWTPFDSILAKILLYFGVPLILLSLYLTSYKKIFPQRVGDMVHSSVLVLVISVFAFCYSDGIGGNFVFLFFLLIAVSILFFDDFIPLFIGGLSSLIVIGEFLLTLRFNSISSISYTIVIRLLLQVISFSTVAWVSSSLVKRTLTEQKISQELQIAYKDLKILDKAKSEFISIASHQLRTPLTAIKGYLSLIQEKIYGAPPKKMKKPIDNIYISTERLIKLVNDLLSISRIEAGKIKPELEILSLEDIIDSIVIELESLAKEKNIYIEWEKHKKPLPNVSADKDKIREVIMNVIDNAIRYTDKGRVIIKTQIQDGKYQIRVKDTGPGMTKEEISHLFTSFKRGVTGQKVWTGGSGLGLYIAKKFIEIQNGEIWAKSPGKEKGSTFYIELPIENKQLGN